VLAERIRELSDHMPVVMLQGTFSHEPAGTLDLFRLVGNRHPVYIADRIHQVALHEGGFTPSVGALFTPMEIEVLLADGMPDVVFTCVPTVNRAMLAVAVGTSDAATAVGWDHLAAYLPAAGTVNPLAARAWHPHDGYLTRYCQRLPDEARRADGRIRS
jgi:exonuclease SbcD